MILEKKLLYFLFCNIPPIIKEKEKSNNIKPNQFEDSKQKIKNFLFGSLKGTFNDKELQLNQNQIKKKYFTKKR